MCGTLVRTDAGTVVVSEETEHKNLVLGSAKFKGDKTW